jgi:hypothetical protein
VPNAIRRELLALIFAQADWCSCELCLLCEQSDGPGPEESDTSGAFREGDVTVLGDVIDSEPVDWPTARYDG